MDYSGFYKPYLIHVVGINDDIWSIAKRYNVKPKDILRMNRGKKLYDLKIGDEIKIPSI